MYQDIVSAKCRGCWNHIDDSNSDLEYGMVWLFVWCQSTQCHWIQSCYYHGDTRYLVVVSAKPSNTCKYNKPTIPYPEEPSLHMLLSALGLEKIKSIRIWILTFNHIQPRTKGQDGHATFDRSGQRRINLPLGNRLYQLLIVILAIVDSWVNQFIKLTCNYIIAIVRRFCHWMPQNPTKKHQFTQNHSFVGFCFVSKLPKKDK